MQSRRYIAGLDGLRALAALAVFGVHFQQITGVAGRVGPFDVQTLLANGNTGVCLFFVLSGFLLSLPFWFGRRPGGKRDANGVARPGVGGLAAGSAAGRGAEEDTSRTVNEGGEPPSFRAQRITFMALIPHTASGRPSPSMSPA